MSVPFATRPKLIGARHRARAREANINANDRPDVTIDIYARPPHTQFLVAEYNGRRPPKELFADLAMIGWHPPVIAPPPRSAIDWTTPDPDTGEPFSVADYWVEGAIVEPPAGSGPKGSWSPAEGAAFMTALRGVLRRHGLDTPTLDEAHGAATGDAGAAPARPSTSGLRTTMQGLSTRWREGGDAATTSAASFAASAGAPVDTIPDGGGVQLRAPVPPARATDLERALAAAGLRVLWETEEVEETTVHRGSTTTASITRAVAIVIAPRDLASVAIDAYVDAMARPSLDVLDADAHGRLAERHAELRAAAVHDDDDERVLVSRTHACVHLLVEPSRGQAVADAIAERRLRHWTCEHATFEAVTSFRGALTHGSRPAFAFEVWVTAAHAPRMLVELAEVAGINRATQPDRAWLTDPEPSPDVAVPETATPAPTPDIGPVSSLDDTESVSKDGALAPR